MNMATSSLRQVWLTICSTYDAIPLKPLGQEPRPLLAQLVNVGVTEWKRAESPGQAPNDFLRPSPMG